MTPTGLTVSDIVAIWRVPRGTVYRLAHEYRWRRYRHGGRIYYHPDDVGRTRQLTADRG